MNEAHYLTNGQTGGGTSGFSVSRLLEPRGNARVMMRRLFAFQVSLEPGTTSSDVEIDLDEEIRREHARPNSTMMDLIAMLSPVGRRAMRSEARVLNEMLREEFARGEVSPVTYYRRLARMSQEQLAGLSGVGQSYISRIERGRAGLTYKQAQKLAPALGVDPKQLIKD